MSIISVSGRGVKQVYHVADADELERVPEPVRCFFIEHTRGGYVVVSAAGRHLTAPHRSYEAALTAARNVAPSAIYGGVIGGTK